ncbi:hypothetical protein A9G11_03415 [Gilliamella sp. wkB108]|uniref:tail fiber assembly protein n=1 Tax=Gilliamella sp. wkB108 TaxID=3120256 RepID=UPI00080EE7C0|nr:tail fiber assembly protein [Gilliamella apicola]OCG24715.1 hypothetical protein A9G11_03415 [Gilliamella apicola]
MIFYNAQTNGFYISEFNDIPADAVEITNECYAQLLQKQSAGLVIQPDKNGHPVAIEYVLTADEIIASNKLEQQQLINAANKKISILQDVIDLGMIESNEAEQLKQWKTYRILLTRVDTSVINVTFPEKPE